MDITAEEYVGTIISGTDTLPFIYEGVSETLRLGEHLAMKTASSVPLEMQEKICKTIWDAPGLCGSEVAFNRFFCSRCGQWADATTEQWSYTICMSCSLDRASEMAEYFREHEI